MLAYECLQDCHMFAPPPIWTLAIICLMQTFSTFFDGCVNRCRETLDLQCIFDWASFFPDGTYHVIFSSNLANDCFNPTPASSLSFFLFTHSFTVYCIHVLFFILISSTESPQVLLAVNFFSQRKLYIILHRAHDHL